MALAVMFALASVPVLLASPANVMAADSGMTILDVRQLDLTANGQPDVTEIDAAFVTDHDRIHVLDQGGGMRWSSDWRQATSFSDEIWLYDIGADGTVQLIVTYTTREAGRAVAYVYDDRDGDGSVGHRRVGTTVEITESPYWTARIVSGSDWFLPDGRLNLAVSVELDGPFQSWGISRPMFDRMPKEFIENSFAHDGNADVTFEQAASEDGIADYAILRLEVHTPPADGFQRSGMYSNDGRKATGEPDRAFFPFLAVAPDLDDPLNAHLRYFDLPPNVQVDWTRGKVVGVFLDGYPIGDGWHANNDRYAIRGQVNDVSFESPQAYYDLALDGDDFAEAHVRFFTRPADDASMWSLGGMESIPWQVVQYDWRLSNPGTLIWDFKIGVAGNYEIEEVVQLGDTSFRIVPFEVLPDWIMERDWKLTTFVAREGPGYASSEGIYEWEPDAGADTLRAPTELIFQAREAAFRYMLGMSATPPSRYFETTLPGYRAERRFSQPGQPQLYFSPIDQKLHLHGAEFGLWTIDEENVIVLRDLHGDGYLDHWQLWRNDELEAELYWTPEFLIYADREQVWLKETQVQTSTYESMPPRTPSEWLRHQQFLAENEPSFEPQQFTAMLRQFPGKTWRLTGAGLRNFRPDGDGFRFILELRRGYVAEGDVGPDLTGLRTGAYVVTKEAAFSVEQARPAELAVSVLPSSAMAAQINSIPVRVQNRGSEDIAGVSLELLATSPEGQQTTVDRREVSVHGRSTVTESLEWAPRTPGTWLLTPVARQGERVLAEGATVSLDVARASIVDETDPLTISGAFERSATLIAVGFVVAALVLLIVLVAWPRAGSRESS